MMFSEIIDEVDFFDSLKIFVPSLYLEKETPLVDALKQAANLANEDEWQNLTNWLITVTKDSNLLLPDILLALQSNWHKKQALPPKLQKQLF